MDLSNLQEDPSDPLFFVKVFNAVSGSRKEQKLDPIESIITEEFTGLSRRADLSRFQESTSIRNVLRARKLAQLLIDEHGEIHLIKIEQAVNCLKKHLYFLGPGRLHDTVRQQHMLRILDQLLQSKSLYKKLKAITKPIQHKYAEQIIRDTLDLSSHTVITDGHTRQAILASMLTYLRQSVGSCFATAPAIIVHQEQPEQYLIDIDEMLSTGRLKRVFEGIEYMAPLSISWGVGDLRKPVYFLHADDIKDFCLSPGLLAALEAVKIVDKDKSLKERLEEAKTYITSSIEDRVQKGRYYVVTAEKILKNILFKHFEINEQILKDYLNRPRDIVFGGLLMNMPRQATSQKGIGEACAHYLAAFEEAKTAFKALADNALLKCWEFTMASFAETKADFARWNLYKSLGLQPEEKGGIGYHIYEMIKRKLEQANRKVEEYQGEYEALYAQLKYVEGRLKSASTEKEVQWLKVEYQSRLTEFQTFEEMRDREHYKAKRYSSLFNDLIDEYLALFPDYFQEVYDADMNDVGATIYDDRPAGFRLLYKHGRLNTAQWTRIDSPQEFVNALASFFVATESQIVHEDAFQGIQNELSEIITTIVGHVKTHEFLESSLYRMMASNQGRIIKNPLEHLDQVEKKPWAYTSGGSMAHLVSCYFNLGGTPQDTSRWVESPYELLTFLVDTTKACPLKVQEEFNQDFEKSLLMHSPTHAFLFKPGIFPFQKAWQTDSYTYTWVRDNLVKPMQRYLETLFLSEYHFDFLIGNLKKLLPYDFQPRFKDVFRHMPGNMNPKEFREYVVLEMSKDSGLRRGQILGEDEIDQLLFNSLPLVDRHEAYQKGETVFSHLGVSTITSWAETLSSLVEHLPYGHILTSKEWLNLLQSAVLVADGKTSGDVPLFAQMVSQARQLGFLMPQPVLFADTNWTLDYFAFLVNPGTGRLELWRVDRLGLQGSPMSMWAEWLDGSRKDIPWGVYPKPQEYRKYIKP